VKTQFKSYSYLVILLYLVVSIWVTFLLDKSGKGKVIVWDVSGYYLYLPSLFIHHDFQNFDYLNKVDAQYRPSGNTKRYGVYPYRIEQNVLKYSSGVAFFYWLFFQVADLYVQVTESYPRDGYSLPYQLSVALSTVLFGVLGLIVLRAFLSIYFKDSIIAFCLLVIAFGTNYFFYTVIGPGMSHVFLFFLYASTLWLTAKWYEHYQFKYIVLLGLVIGWAALARPTEILLVLIPLLWSLSNKSDVKDRLLLLLDKKLALLTFILVLAAIVSIQLLYWKATTGNLIVYSYQGQGHFNFFDPNILDGIFSYRKGWLIYAPIMIFSLIGFVPLFKYQRKLFVMVSVYFLLTVYVVFSWSPWWYGGGFGARALIQSYALLSIPLACFISWLFTNRKKSLKRVISFSITVLSVLFVLLNIFQSYQYHKGIMHWENMNNEYYWAVFGKLKVSEEDQLLIER